MLHQLIGVFGDAEEPLLQVAPDDRRVAALADAFHHLLVGQHGLAAGAPVDRGLGAVGQAGLVELQEEPLRPFVVLGQAGDDLAAPVVDGAHGLQLAAHVLDVLHGPGEGMDAALDGGVLRRQAEGVEAHGMQHVVALHPLEAGVDIRRGHGVPVADVQVARGVGEHGQGVPLGTALVFGYLVEAVSGPLLLPLGLDFRGNVFGNHY